MKFSNEICVVAHDLDARSEPVAAKYKAVDALQVNQINQYFGFIAEPAASDKDMLYAMNVLGHL